ncbi:hypothetical protein MRB53_032728 [Persea americana]|uniref:Uncharacterized protein n=1 Tax=Persea americana TaxID=3435 RepID=A0ACC2KSX2_PERAE|nr:hypothetical protein MRB53_032728 [Persea americana]
MDNEITYADKGVSLVIHHSLKAFRQEDQTENIFNHRECYKNLMAATMEPKLNWSIPPVNDEYREEDVEPEELKILTTRHT